MESQSPFTEEEQIKIYLRESFDYDQLRYTTLDYRGAPVATRE